MRAFHVCGSLALLILSARGSVASSKRESKASDDAALRWGPYRPNLYFGVRPQIPDTLLMGMMWGQGQDKATLIDSTSRPLPDASIQLAICAHAGTTAQRSSPRYV